MLYNILFIFLIVSHAWAAPKCIQCHHNNQELQTNYQFLDLTKEKMPDNCQSCHVNIHAAVNDQRSITWPTHLKSGNEKLFTEEYLYVNNPALIYKINGITRFTDCGLRSFLKNPVPRKYGAQNSMFPLNDQEIDEAISENKIPLVKCTSLEKNSDLYNKGEKLFLKHCLSCHDASASLQGAPKIRLGHPLFSKDYFEARVKNKNIKKESNFIYHYYWKTQNKQLKKIAKKNDMPVFSHLTKTDIDALYHFVAHNADDLRSLSILGAETINATNPLELYNVVEEKIINGSCKHCHFNSNTMISAVFDTKKAIPSLFNDNRPLLKSDELSAIFSVDQKCGPSTVEKVLLERHLEFKGQKTNHNIKGMPLNLAPLSLSAIKSIRAWTLIGCPSPSGYLCIKRPNCS